MAFFKWKDSYRVGMQPLDDQHKQLMEMVHDLYNAMRAGRGNEVLGSLFNNLLEYTRTHFAAEEELMRQCGFPGLSEHRQLHERLTRQVLESAEQFRAGKTGMPVHTAMFLKEWLVDHIQVMDKKYVPFMSSKTDR